MAMADLARGIGARRPLAADRRGRQVVPAAARARHGRPRLHRDHRRDRSPRACTQLETASPAFAVVDMRLDDGNGLDVISALKRRRPDARAIILTGYGNIATAVNAVKLGAVDYLSKPVDADDVVAALLALDGRKRRAAGKSDVGRPRALGAHPAHLRAVRPQRLGDRAPAQHAPAHAAADPGQARAEVSRPPAALQFGRQSSLVRHGTMSPWQSAAISRSAMKLIGTACR